MEDRVVCSGCSPCMWDSAPHVSGSGCADDVPQPSVWLGSPGNSPDNYRYGSLSEKVIEMIVQMTSPGGIQLLQVWLLYVSTILL